MNPVVQVYLTWGAIASVLAAVLYVVLGRRPEHERLGPVPRAAGAIFFALLIIVTGPRSRYGTRRPSMASKQLADAKKTSAHDQAVREGALAALKKAEGARDLQTGIALSYEGDKLHARGWSEDAVKVYRRAYEILIANGAGNGDWQIDHHLASFLAKFIEDLKAQGEANEAGRMRAVLSTMRTRHGAAKVP